MRFLVWGKKHLFLLLLLFYAFITRIGYLWDNAIPFSFDHGKDSLAILDMLVNLSPKFIGPWTSIPGLYFGPAWYYLLAPFYLLTGFNPVGGAVAMLALVLLQVFLAYKYLGKYEAVLIATAPLWFILSKSAWNPYPMTLISLVLLILLKKARAAGKLTLVSAFLLGLFASFGFHFSAAFAIFYPVSIVCAVLFFRIRFRLKEVLATGLGFFLPFLPQFLFELKYNFSQTRTVLAYFQQGESDAFGSEKILQVLKTTSGEIALGIFPETSFWGSLSVGVLVILLLGLGWVLLRQFKKSKEIRENSVLCLFFAGLPVLGFFFLHFNVWYVYAMVPAFVVLVASLLRQAPAWFRSPYLILLLLSPAFAYYQYFSVDKAQLEASRGFLPVKLTVLEEVEQRAAGRPYASYQYVPDIYDYSYQYLYFWRAAHGHALPVEFSYQPGESSYVVQKPDLLRRFPASDTQPEVIFFIVETPERQIFLERWWGQQRFGEIEQEVRISDDITLYVATPPNQIPKEE